MSQSPLRVGEKVLILPEIVKANPQHPWMAREGRVAARIGQDKVKVVFPHYTAILRERDLVRR